MKLRKITTLLMGALLFFYSCEQPLNEISDGGAEKAPAPIGAGESGTLTVTVPLISSVLQKTLEPAEPESRAYLFAKDVALILLDSVGAEIGRTETSFPGGTLENPGAALTAEMDVPWGLGYTVRVQIRDGADVLVTGDSAPFDMGFDRVGLSVSLLPANPAVLQAGSRTGSLTASVYGSGGFASMGGEAWFSLTPDAAEMAVLTVETEGEAVLFHADDQGSFVGSARGHDPSQPTVLTASAGGSETAFAGLIILDDTTVSEDYTLNYQSVQQGIVKLNLTGMDGETGSPLTIEIIPSGGTEPAASLNTSLTDGAMTLYLFEEDGLNLWEGAGDYELRAFIDRNSSGAADRDDPVLARSVTLAEGENSIDLALSDFALFAPDITGRWYCLNDETALDPDFIVMEIVADINGDGTFAVYARRHAVPTEEEDPNWSANVPGDTFLPVLRGVWALTGYDLTATVTEAALLNLSVLEGSLDDAYYSSALSLLSLFSIDGAETLTYQETLSLLDMVLPLLPEDVTVNDAVLEELFQPFSQGIEELAATGADGSDVSGYSATLEVTDTSGTLQTRTYSLIDTYQATDLGNGAFRTPLALP